MRRTFVFLQNDHTTLPSYYLERNELQDHFFRKRHMGRGKFDTRYVLIGPPQATDEMTVQELEDEDIVGFYGMIVEDEDAGPRQPAQGSLRGTHRDPTRNTRVYADDQEIFGS